MRVIYATIDDFNGSDYCEDDDGNILQVTAGRLGRASRDIEHLLLTAVYYTDEETGLPTDSRILEALKAATCAQAAWGLLTENASGAQSVIGQIELGPLHLGAARSMSAGALSTQTAQAVRISPEAIQELTNAGLTPGQVWHQ